MKRQVLLVFLLLMESLFQAVDAQEFLGREGSVGSDTLELMFRVGQTDVDLSFADNSIRLEDFIYRLRLLEASRRGDYYIRVVTGASPDGPAEQNRRIGERRGTAIRELLSERMQQEGMDIWCSRIVVTNEGARWARLYHDLAQSNEPWRHRVLAILRQPARTQNEWMLDSREQQLRALNGGRIWQQLQERYLPQLRSVGTAVLVPISAGSRRDTLVIRDTVYYMPQITETLTSQEALNTLKALKAHKEKVEKVLRPVLSGPSWSLKSNLLMLCVITPNMEFEHSLGSKGRWSILASAAFARWTIGHNAYANHFIYADTEMRLWLGNRQKHSTLDGWHLGLGAGAGIYDVGWNSRGYQGEALTGFLNIGWQHRMGKRQQWLIDLGVGVGGLVTKYREYTGSSKYPEKHTEAHDDHLMWQRNGHLNWPGATHLNISIGYVWGRQR